MGDVVDDIMALWQGLPDGEEEARSAFARLYASRVMVNGAELTLDDLVARARAMQSALSDVSHELLERVEVADKLVVAFKLHGRHTGPLRTSIGDVPATGKEVTIQGMDVLTFTGGRITKITVLADELGMLSRLDVVTLR
jgi:predicted ester cyclase